MRRASTVALLALALALAQTALGQTQEHLPPGALPRTVASIASGVPPGTWATYVVTFGSATRVFEGSLVEWHTVVACDPVTISVERPGVTPLDHAPSPDDGARGRRFSRPRGDVNAFLVALVFDGERLSAPPTIDEVVATVGGAEVACLHVLFEVALHAGGTARCEAWISSAVPGIGLVGLVTRTTSPRGGEEASVRTLAGFGGPDAVCWGTRTPDLHLDWPRPLPAAR